MVPGPRSGHPELKIRVTGDGSGREGYMSKRAWGKGGLERESSRMAGQEGTALLSFHVTKGSSEKRGNSSRLFFLQSSDIKP